MYVKSIAFVRKEITVHIKQEQYGPIILIEFQPFLHALYTHPHDTFGVTGGLPLFIADLKALALFISHYASFLVHS